MRRSTRIPLAFVVALLIGGGAALAVGAFDGNEPAGRPPAERAFTSPEDPRRPAVVWAVGDTDATEGGAELARAVVAAGPVRFLYLGDVYENGTREEFERRYAVNYGPLADRTAPTPGNHEWPAHAEGYDRYWRAVTGERTPHWYAFDVGGWRVVSLNSEGAHDEDSRQLEWLRREVRRRGVGTCRLAMWHRPLESAGKYGNQPDVEPFHDVLRGHARISLHGHDHNSQRLRPRGGIHAFVVGAGGRQPFYEVDPEDDRLRFGDDERFAALRIALRPGVARLAYYTAYGEVLDRKTVRCRP